MGGGADDGVLGVGDGGLAGCWVQLLPGCMVQPTSWVQPTWALAASLALPEAYMWWDGHVALHLSGLAQQGKQLAALAKGGRHLGSGGTTRGQAGGKQGCRQRGQG